MLSEQRIKEAEQNVKSYLDDGLIKKPDFEEIVFKVLEKNAKESLELANFLEKQGKSDMWIIIISYYSMYYIANAVIYKQGYKIGDKISHKITADSLIVYVRKQLTESLLESYEEAKEEAMAGIKADSIIESFDYERKKRGLIQYQTTDLEKHSKAKTSLNRAKGFMFEMKKLLEEEEPDNKEEE